MENLQSTQWDELTVQQFVTPTIPDATNNPPKSTTTRGGKGKKNNLQNQQQSTSKISSDYTLKSIVELLILLGLTSATMWEKILFQIKSDVSNLMNTEVTNLYFSLKLVAQSVCSGVIQSGDLSQQKLEIINDSEREHTELMSYIEPTLNLLPQIFYSTDSVKHIKNFIATALKENNATQSSDEPPCKKQKNDTNTNTTEAMLNLFGKTIENKKKKSKEVVISQQFSLRDEQVLRKYATPGETGKLMVKIEITDCDDLKGVGVTQYWTKVWKKAVFLLDGEDDPAFKTIDNILLDQLKNISEIKDVKMTEYDDEGSSSRKFRFGRN